MDAILELYNEDQLVSLIQKIERSLHNNKIELKLLKFLKDIIFELNERNVQSNENELIKLYIEICNNLIIPTFIDCSWLNQNKIDILNKSEEHVQNEIEIIVILGNILGYILENILKHPMKDGFIKDVEMIISAISDILVKVSDVFFEFNCYFEEKEVIEQLRGICILIKGFLKPVFLSSKSIENAIDKVISNTFNILKNSQTESISGILLVLLIEPYMKEIPHKTNIILLGLVEILINFYQYEHDFITKQNNPTGYFILVFLSEYAFAIKLLNNFQFKNVCDIINFGLMNSDPLMRKRSLYVLRKLLDILEHNSFGICIDYIKHPEENIWMDYFIVYETLEETQLHLINPSLIKIDKLLKDEKIIIYWLLPLLKRMYDHTHRFIKLQGIEYTFKFLKFNPKKSFFVFICQHFIPLLSNQYLYLEEIEENSRNSLGNSIECFFTSCFEKEVIDQHFFLKFLANSIFTQTSWSSVPMYYIVNAISNLPKYKIFGYSDLNQISTSYMSTTITHESIFRFSGQLCLIRFIINQRKSEINLAQLCSVLSNFEILEMFNCTELWTHLTEEMEHYENDDSIFHALKSINSNDYPSMQPISTAIGICLHFDHSNDTSEKLFEKYFHDIYINLIDCQQRPYIKMEQFIWSLSVMEVILNIQYSNVHSNSSSLKFKQILMKFYDSFEDVLKYIHIPRKNFESIEECLNLINTICKFEDFNKIFTAYLNTTFLQHYSSGNDGLFKDEILLAMVSNHSQKISGGNLNKFLNLIEQSIKRKLITNTSTVKVHPNFSKCLWNSVLFYVKQNLGKEVNVDTIFGIYVGLKENLHCATKFDIVSQYEVAIQLCPIAIQNNEWESMCDLLLHITFDFQKSCRLFRKLIHCIIQFVFHEEALTKEENHDFIIKIFKRIYAMGDSIPEIVCSLACQCVSIATSLPKAYLVSSFPRFFSDIFLQLLMYGNTFQKQWKIMIDASEEILHKNHNMEKYKKDYYGKESRLALLSFILSLDSQSKDDCKIASKLANCVQQHFTKFQSVKRSKDFANSFSHRFKTRLLQVLLILLPYLSVEECLNHLVWICDAVIKEQQQPSVRYFLEWSMILIPLKHTELVEELSNQIEKATNERISCIGSFLAVLTHIGCALNNKQLLQFTLQNSVRWCMTNQFNTRLYAQVSMHKMLNHCEKNGYDDLCEHYKSIRYCIDAATEEGKNRYSNTTHNMFNMTSDFYFTVFHPIQHYSLQSIFYEIPRLSMMMDDELINIKDLEIFSKQLQLYYKSSIKYLNDDELLSDAKPPLWVLRAAGKDDACLNKKSEINSNSENLQKKIMPLNSMISQFKDTLDIPRYIIDDNEINKNRNSPSGNLIVVASLLDKSANLGGLCRTCEIFQMEKLIVNSLSVIDDPTFSSLSLTAHQWIPIEEVKQENLSNYLKQMGDEGYALIAAEQTSNSQCLSEFKFPQKSILLLGNEKEGIPCNLLQFVNYCIEIPQLGIIRSLNVHVSGALFMWEYTRQKILNQLKL